MQVLALSDSSFWLQVQKIKFKLAWCLPWAFFTYYLAPPEAEVVCIADTDLNKYIE